MGARKTDVLVLGGGVIGLTCALALLRQGRGVTVLEQNTAGSAASHGNCGTLTPSLLPLPAPGMIPRALKWMASADSPLLIRPRLDVNFLGWLLRFAANCNEKTFRATLSVKLPLLLRSRELIEQLIHDEQLDCEFEASGHLQVFRSAAAFAQAQRMIPWSRECGLVTEILDGSQARALEPALNDSVVGALSNPGDAQLRPERFLAELARVVRAAGGVIEEHTGVTGFKREHELVTAVHSNHGDYHGRDIVLALGAWSPLLSRQLGLRLPVQPGKGYSVTYENSGLQPKIPLVLKERAVCVTRWPSGYRLGSTLEFSGYDRSLNRIRLDALQRGAREYLCELPPSRVVEEWYGWRPMSSDDLPIIGRAPGLDNLWLATGHGMLGMTLSAVTAQLISEMICGRQPSLNPEPLSAARFSR